MSARLTPRPWDSEFFGFPVAQIDGRRLEEEPLTAALLEAQHAGFELVYWQADAGRDVSTSLLDRFTGELVDRRVTYRLSLDGAGQGLRQHAEMENGLPSPSIRSGDGLGRPSSYSSLAVPGSIVEHPIGGAGDELIQLAIAAGEFSRFRVDRRFPKGLFEALYRTWIERSTLHEIADAVLVARSDGGRVDGMATVSVHPPSGTIGLISVREDARGLGIGRALVSAAHLWMADRGIAESSVTTQACNAPACALYERCGYRVADRSHFYHFWPGNESHHGT